MPRLKYALNGGRASVSVISLLTSGLDAAQGRQCAAHGDNTILVGLAALCEKVFPPELLDRSLFDGQSDVFVLRREAGERGRTVSLPLASI